MENDEYAKKLFKEELKIEKHFYSPALAPYSKRHDYVGTYKLVKIEKVTK